MFVFHSFALILKRGLLFLSWLLFVRRMAIRNTVSSWSKTELCVTAKMLDKLRNQSQIDTQLPGDKDENATGPERTKSQVLCSCLVVQRCQMMTHATYLRRWNLVPGVHIQVDNMSVSSHDSKMDIYIVVVRTQVTVNLKTRASSKLKRQYATSLTVTVLWATTSDKQVHNIASGRISCAFLM